MIMILCFVCALLLSSPTRAFFAGQPRPHRACCATSSRSRTTCCAAPRTVEVDTFEQHSLEPRVTTQARDALTSRIKGFYPFHGGRPRGPIAWLLRDTHQAIIVSSPSGDRVFMDFMTEGGAAHPVWWDEASKWQVMLGGCIRGEVRMRNPRPSAALRSDPKLDRLRAAAAEYPRSMNIYTNNCRVFCARMEREVARLNSEDPVAADARLAYSLLCAGLLPALYPGFFLWLCWSGLRDLVM